MNASKLSLLLLHTPRPSSPSDGDQKLRKLSADHLAAAGEKKSKASILWRRFSVICLAVLVCGEQVVHAQVETESSRENISSSVSVGTKKARGDRQNSSEQYRRAKQEISDGEVLRGIELLEKLLQENPESSETKADREIWIGTAISELLVEFRARNSQELQYLEKATMLLTQYEQECLNTYGSEKMNSPIVQHWSRALEIASEEWGEQQQQLAEFKQIQVQAREAFHHRDYVTEARLWQSAIVHPLAPPSGFERAELFFNAVEASLRIQNLQLREEYLDQAEDLLRQVDRETKDDANPKIQSESTRLLQEVKKKQQENRFEQVKIQLDGSIDSIHTNRRRTGQALVGIGGSMLGLALGGFIAAPLIVPAAEQKIIDHPKEKHPDSKPEEYRGEAIGWKHATIVMASIGATMGTAAIIWGIVKLRRAKRGGGKHRNAVWLSHRTNRWGEVMKRPIVLRW